MFDTVLIANRGEIALRIQRAVEPSDCERLLSIRKLTGMLHTSRMRIPRSASARLRPGKSYLDGAAILLAAEVTGAQAIHPGYGFLSGTPSLQTRLFGRA